ncbi:MAG: thioredoxin domain-containing protein [Flavobacteriales bacterium]|nr:thioredoxin domain-containing protein [Flavobacteriales bacterium]
MTKPHTNSLINETSPYLLQHAHNPVNWLPWNKETLKKAQQENKPLIISIGYSACHWCHVMEHECFEDEEVAQVMNTHFVCIKVDREERPDIDNIYMTAVQLMQQRGGWPLNCFALPDGKPFYGGTYYPKQNWMQLLNSVASEFQNNYDEIVKHANNVTKGIIESDLIKKTEDENPFDMSVLEVAVTRIKKHFDLTEGGTDRAPKFPLPNNYSFLLQYYYHTKDKSILDFVELTLKKMAYGGIYDQIGGGFARYSVDGYWKVPHFEKMLYDNGQLVSLYSEAYQLTKNSLYKNVVYQTLAFVERELMAENGAFYSALDADSEGEEGKFYVWTKEELQAILKDDFALIQEYYNLNSLGFWEGNQILLRIKDDTEIAKKFNLSLSELEQKIKQINALLLNERAKRVRPGLDDKTLTSWNALMLKGFVDAYQVFGEKNFLNAALKNAHFIINHQLRKDGGLNHNYKNGISNIDGYLEDYSFTIEAFISLYQATFNETWLNHSKKLADYCIEHFQNKENSLFYFTSKDAKDIIARKIEIADNVIPASNSSIAKALFLLGKYFDKEKYSHTAHQMLKNIEKDISNYIFSYSNWGILLLNMANSFFEVAICGKDAFVKLAELNQYYLPNKLMIGSIEKSNLPLLEGKQVNEKTMLYVCYNKSCQKPTDKVEEAITQLQ